MADVFVSYSHQDREVARRYADALSAAGLSVWWDDHLRTGEAFDEKIEAALRAASAVVVLWSRASVASRWVRAEATLADRNGTLVPVMIEPCERPIMFELSHTSELGHWTGDADDRAWLSFLADVRRRIGGRSSAVTTVEQHKSAVLAGPSSAGDGSRIVVLPFRARANDEIEQVTAEGLTDDITTLLTSVKGLSVTPRTSLRRSLEAEDSPVKIAMDLRCRYAVTGSVRRSGSRLRVSAELIDVSDNQQKWSQRFDRTAEDLFAIQDEIAVGVVVAVGGVISRAEGMRALRAHPNSLQAWELVRRASSVGWDWRPETLQQGMLDARKALEFDPNYAMAHGWLAHILAFRVAAGWSGDVELERLEAVRESDETVRLGFDDPGALWLVIAAYWAAGYPERSIQLYERSIQRRADIFLTMPFAMGVAGVGYAQAGRVEEGLALIRQFEAEFPNDAWGSVWTRVFVGYAELCRGNFALVSDVLANPPSELDGMCRVVALMCMGREDEAIAQYASLAAANPAISLDHYARYFKGYSADREIGDGLSVGVERLRSTLSLRGGKVSG